MIIRKIAVFVVLAGLFSAGCMPMRMMKKFNSGEGSITAGSEAVIPFELRGHAPVVEVSFNGDPEKFRLIMDTGAMTFIQEEAAARIDYIDRGEIPTFDKEQKAQLAEFASVESGDARVENMIGVVFNFMSRTGYDDADGLLGSDFLRFYKVKFDYVEQKVTLSQEEEPLISDGDGAVMPMKTPLPLRAPMVKCLLNGAIKGEAMIDTGSPYSIVLPLSFKEKLTEAGEIELVKSAGIMARWPMSKTDDSYLSRLESIEIGDILVENIPVIFADVEWILLGKGFLDRYVFTVDYPGKSVLFEPVAGMDFEHNVYSTGIGIKRNDAGEVVVKGFWQGSPAEKAGIKVGDRIRRIHDLEAADNPVWKLYEPLNNDDLKVIEIEILRGGEVEIIMLEKEFLLTSAE